MKGGKSNMPTITLSVPEDLKQEMDEFKEMNWSEVARAAIRQKLTELALFKAMVGKSKLSEKEAEEFSLKLGRKVKKSMHEKFKKLHPSAF